MPPQQRHSPRPSDYADPAPGDRDLTRYRANVGLALFRADGAVFFGRRTGDKGRYGWQMPQGGIDPGETALQAAWRELWEETGVTEANAELLGQMDDWLVYDFPPEVLRAQRAKGRTNLGQKQLWFAFRFTGLDADINLSATHDVEFDRFRWDDLDATVGQVIPWKRPVYRAMAQHFAKWAKPQD